MGHYCKVCDKQISEGRIKLGYTTSCVEHSSTFKYVGFVAGSNKSDYEISIVRDKETAEHMQQLLDTRGLL
jgi:hypothetical protein